MKYRSLILISAVTLIMAISLSLSGILKADAEYIDLPDERHATSAEEEVFLALHLRYHRMIDAARASGDVSDFSTLLIDDPGYDMAKLTSGCLDLVDRYRDRINQAIASSAQPDQPADTGILSCSIANIKELHESYRAWSAVKATASAEGRTPVSADLPKGLSPLDKPRAVGAFDGAYIIEAMVEGEYALVDYSFDSSGGSMQEHLLLHQIGGQWYIAGMWAEGNG